MSENRIYNFSAGPAVLPIEVLETVKENLLNYKSSGLGVMELSHRGNEFSEIIESTEASLRELLGVPNDYSVLFTTGGATNQFSMVPLNFASKKEGEEAQQKSAYILTGSWSKKAIKEASRFGETHVAATSEDKNFSYIPETLDLPANLSYLHFTSNNTIFGTQFKTEPEAKNNELICDASSDFLHKKIDITKYGLIYAGAQKNLGPAGVTIVIVKNELLERCPSNLPLLMNYKTYFEGKSLSNTPPTFPIYVVGEVLKWIKDQGGLDKMEERNTSKASLLYDYIDKSDFYKGTADKESRSLMNVCFRLKDEELEKEFMQVASETGFSGLKGHRSVGGMRASIYNAFPKQGVEALVKFMQQFEDAHS